VLKGVPQGHREVYDTRFYRGLRATIEACMRWRWTTLAATLALLFFAGEVLRPFSIVMAFGVVVAVFSSMYVATPLLLYIEARYPRGEADRQHRTGAAAEMEALTSAGASGRKAAKARNAAPAR